MAADSVKYIESLTIKLNSESPSRIKKALAALTKATKNKENVRLFRIQGGLNRLLALIRRPNKSIADMALSTLANCALEEDSRQEIRRLDGIVSLVDMLKMIQKTSILNRTARALANLAEDYLNADVMEELGVIPALVKLLTETSDSDCQQSVLRALRIICTIPKRKQAVLDLDGFKTVVELLKSENVPLVNCCMRTIAEFTKNCGKEIAQQVQENGGIKVIVSLADGNTVARNPALLSLANLAYHSHVRVCIGSEGGVQALTKQIKRGDPLNVTTKAVEGICFCCREAINRTRVLECGALELLLKLLTSAKPLPLEKKIVTAFTCFYYSDPALEVLLNGGLVPALINHLDRVISHASSCEEVDDDISDQLSFSSDFASEPPRVAAVKGSLFDTSGEAIADEEFLQKLEDTAREVSDTQASGRLTNFKRRMKLKPSPILTTPSPSVRTIGLGQSVFSVACRQTDTTSLVSVCTPSCSISTLASGSSINASTSVSSSLPSASQTVAFETSNTSLRPNQSIAREVNAVTTEDASSKHTTANLIRATTCMDATPSDQVVFNYNVTSETSRNSKLLSPTSPKTGAAPQHHHGPGYNVLLLLSRISQMTDPSPLLVNKPCIQAMLKYILAVPNPSPKCVRLLNRLATNPSCFKALVVTGAVVAFHHCLCCGYRELESQHAMKRMDLFPIQDVSEEKKSLYSSSTMTRMEDVAHAQTQSICSINADEQTEYNKFPCVFSSSHNHSQEAGRQLLDSLASQAQTPFGQGELENLLLKGCQEESQQCVLALPMLCRSKKLRFHLLVEKKGLRLFCHLLATTSPTDETFMAAVESLVVLAEDLQVKPPGDGSYSEGNSALNASKDGTATAAENQPAATTKMVHGEMCSSFEHHTSELQADRVHMSVGDTRIVPNGQTAKQFKLDPNVTLELVPSGSVQEHCINRSVDTSCCMYSTSKLGVCDVKFRMDSGELIPVHRQVITAASDVFAAMLSSNYLEGTQSVIPIPEISLDVFEVAIHHAYGCSLSCPYTVLSQESCELQRQGTKSDFFLELLTFADRFLMDRLKAVSERCLVQLIGHVNVVQFCILGLQLNSTKLCMYCLCYLLQGKISDLPRNFHLFRELFMCDEKEALEEHLFQLLLSHLRS